MLLTSCTCLDRAVGDAVSRKIDPTGTGDIRARFNSDLRRRWARLRVVINEVLVRDDLLGLGAVSSSTILRSMNDPVKAFQTFVDEALGRIVLGGAGGWLIPYLQEASWRGRARAARGVGWEGAMARARTDTVVASGAIAELQGIMEVVSQRAVRAAADGMIKGLRARQISALVNLAITRVGVIRSKAMVNFSIVRAYNIATLDAFEDFGVRLVDVEAERQLPKNLRLGDQEELVEVLTAGDDKVCEECEDISQEGPYEISEARGLIPAHPNCRCAFVPWDDARFAEIERE